MAHQNGAGRLFYWLVVLLTVIIATFATVTILQIRWTTELQRKYAQNRQQIDSLRITCVEKLLRDAFLAEYGSQFHSSKRQSGSLQQMLQEMMLVQEKVLLSHCMNNTGFCVHGQKGQLGSKGVAGVAGATGQSGPAGQTGQKGTTGQQGLAGEKGGKGPVGRNGNQGQTGPAGPQGPKGFKGSPGQAGISGSIGRAGEKGEQGQQGDIGSQGPIGDLGRPGLTGSKGDMGIVGLKGALGLPGPLGPTGDALQKNCMCIIEAVIDTFPQPKQYPIGSLVTLTCDSSTSPKPTITWYLPTGGCGVKKFVGSRLTINSLQPVDLGQYRCEAKNIYGSVSRTYDLQSNLTGVLDCDFDTPNMCNWKNNPTGHMGNWQLHRGPTSTSGTGPGVDHTLGTSRGYYVYTDSLSSGQNNHVQLESVALGHSGPSCLTFWYHMNGDQQGSLNVKITDNCYGNSTSYATLKGDAGDLWHLEEVQLPPMAGNHTITLTSIQGNGYRSDVAIDDVIYYPGQCRATLRRTGPTEKNITVAKGDKLVLNCGTEGFPQPTFTWSKPGGCLNQSNDGTVHVTDYATHGHDGTYTCTTSSPGTTPLTTTFNVKVTGGNEYKCTFESGMCGWTQDKNDIFDWTIITGPTDSKETGPSNDHTLGTSSGHYMYTEASSPRNPGDDAILRSPLMKANETTCLQMYYNMYGVDMGNLTVMTEDACTHVRHTLFVEKLNQGDTWLSRTAKISADQVPHDYYVLIRGTRGSDFHSDIAFDDIEFGDCNKTNASSPTFVDCTFDDGLCSWTQSATDTFDWSRNHGPTGSSGTGPTADHTLGTQSGYYLYTEASYHNAGQTAELVSPTIPGGNDYCFHLATNMYGSSMGQIRVYTEESGSRVLKATFSQKDTTSVWRTQNVDLGHMTRPFRLIIEGVVGKSYLSDAAIDDVRLVQGRC